MHRSGTSSAAGTLVRLGAAAPQHLIAPSVDNERGFWESRVIADLNDAILAAAGSDWKDWRRFDLAKIDDVEADALRVRAKAALADEFGDVGFAVIKDPRMCRLMPFWGPVFAEAKWSVRALLPIRSPLEVGQSLNCRDGIGARLRVPALATPRPGRRGRNPWHGPRCSRLAAISREQSGGARRTPPNNWA